jgi:hypothetical protein
MVFFRSFTYKFTVAEWFSRSPRKREVWSSNPSNGNSFFFKLFKSNKHWIEYQCCNKSYSQFTTIKALESIGGTTRIISQPAPFLHSETQTNSAPSVLWLIKGMDLVLNHGPGVRSNFLFEDVFLTKCINKNIWINMYICYIIWHNWPNRLLMLRGNYILTFYVNSCHYK